MTTYLKDPDAVLDYAVDWSAWLPTGDTIVASTWAVPTGITQTTPPPSFTDTAATIWLAGGTLGQTYELVNHVTTAQGRQDDWTIKVSIRER
jgi:hypothetical protein